MSMTDPIADMLTRIRNAGGARFDKVDIPASRMKISLARILKEEGFIEEVTELTSEDMPQPTLLLALKYVGMRRERRPVIAGLERISKPGRRVYARKKDIPWVLSGMGVAILSTPQGVMTGARARKLGVGGEVLCKVW